MSRMMAVHAPLHTPLLLRRSNGNVLDVAIILQACMLRSVIPAVEVMLCM
jgi:hypothetical protein